MTSTLPRVSSLLLGVPLNVVAAGVTKGSRVFAEHSGIRGVVESMKRSDGSVEHRVEPMIEAILLKRLLLSAHHCIRVTNYFFDIWSAISYPIVHGQDCRS